MYHEYIECMYIIFIQYRLYIYNIILYTLYVHYDILYILYVHYMLYCIY